ncbi:Uncharacterised protein [Klebsiella variicola]|nr:Uncharacterised protein [Klebsiella variicola]
MIRNSQFHECVHRHHMLDKLVITKKNYFVCLIIFQRTILSFGITPYRNFTFLASRLDTGFPRM